MTLTLLAQAAVAAAPAAGAIASAADATTERTVRGLLAWSHDQPATAELLLNTPGDAELEDWRLLILSEAAEARLAHAVSRRALDELLALHPRSPLRPRALVRAVELAGAAGDLVAAKRWIAIGRSEPLPATTLVALEQVAWRLGRDRGDRELLDSSARRLLVEAPLEASKLHVVDTLAMQREVGADWRLLLTAEELERRAAALLAADLPSGALTTLAAVREERRGLSWRLLEARALTAAERGIEALARLATVDSSDPAVHAEIEWERALAAFAAAGLRPGKATPTADPTRYRRQAREHLLVVARSATAPARVGEALRRLAIDHLAEQRVAEAVAALRQLAAVDPNDTSGARPLWERGWAAFERGDLSRARSLWADLVAVYPRTSAARSARYWTARALEKSGDANGARAGYVELLAADTADFYARQAALRLAGAVATVSEPVERDLWPHDPKLARAERLTELGLEALAARELALLGDQAEPRAAAALEALVLHRQGDRRASLTLLRRAFPELGTAHQARVPEVALALFYPTDFREAIARAAASQRVSTTLVLAMIHQESAFDPAALSRSGARGLMQLMPTTGKEVARQLRLPFSTAKLSEPDFSVVLGTRYLRQMLDTFDGKVELALAGYNAGPGRISRLWRAAGPSAELDRFLEGLIVTESRNYVKRILVLAESYRSLYPDLG